MCVLLLCHLTFIHTLFLWINFKQPHVYSSFIVDTMLFSFVDTIRFKNFGQHVIHFYILDSGLLGAGQHNQPRHDSCHQERRPQEPE